MQARHALTLGNFFAAGHFFLILFILAPYLATFMPAEQTGLVLSLGAVITLSVFPFAPHLVRKYGAKRLAIGLGSLQAVMLSILAGNPIPIIAIVSIALVCATSPILAYQFDLLLEATVKNEEETGRIRTIFLTAGNLALVAAPLLVGYILDGTARYDYVFLAAAISLTPFIMLFLVEKLPEGVAPRVTRLRSTLTCMRKDPDLRAVATAQGILQVAFHLAPIYVPLYLHTALGMPWNELGWVFALSLVPFIFIEYPAGWLADRYLGDRKLLVAGFIIMGISFTFFAFVTATTSLLAILLILLGTRIGGALCEAMIEGHFFRRVSERDADTIGVFRMLRPAGGLFAALSGTVLLAFGGYSTLFIVAGCVIAVLGVLSTLAIQDVRIRKEVGIVSPA